MSSAVHLLLGAPEVNIYLDAHELRDATVDLETILLDQAEDGTPLVLFVVQLDDGSRVLAKATYRVMQTVLAGMRGALQRRSYEVPRTCCIRDGVTQAIYPCGCSHHKVELGMCSVYAPDGSLRSEVDRG
jgi:hypothetical protein